MRIALILLSIIALIFIGSISWSLIQTPTGGWRTQSVQTEKGIPDIETLRQQIKTEEKLNELDAMVRELAKQNGIDPKNPQKQDTTETPEATSTGKIIPLSGKFLSKILQKSSLELTENDGIYGLYTFDKIFHYSTYEDKKMTLKAIAIQVNYDTFLKNAKALGKEVYSVNETQTFPFKSFYMNPPKSDTLVRLVLEIETQTIALEITKTKYPLLKELLSKK